VFTRQYAHLADSSRTANTAATATLRHQCGSSAPNVLLLSLLLPYAATAATRLLPAQLLCTDQDRTLRLLTLRVGRGIESEHRTILQHSLHCHFSPH